jgi:hypothetical protein
VAWIDRRERFAGMLVTGLQATDALLNVPYDVALQA